METSLESLMEEFMKLPDWKRFPLPECLYQKFNLPKPKATSIVDYFNEFDLVSTFAPGPEIEVRPPAEGGVRTMPEAPPLQLITETETEHPPEMPEDLASSKANVSPKSQELESHSESSPHSEHDAVNTSPS